MYALKSQDQGLITLSQQDYLPILVESFLIDRRSQGLSPNTIEFYTKKLQYFQKYCERQALTQISQLTSDFIRMYLLELSEAHNPGGVHACFRPLRTLLYWIEEEEIMPAGWKNPIRRVKAPKWAAVGQIPKLRRKAARYSKQEHLQEDQADYEMLRKRMEAELAPHMEGADRNLS
ncbi:MAG: phage integrase N-terminal SAM-like domain-containing protein [Anaerolineales bacterium]|nr:phage integrase N-terminal SAM-like domain-containing protein [Anaerolineales bacterium]